MALHRKSVYQTIIFLAFFPFPVLASLDESLSGMITRGPMIHRTPGSMSFSCKFLLIYCLSSCTFEVMFFYIGDFK